MSASTQVILITGGCGYLGSQFIRDLAAEVIAEMLAQVLKYKDLIDTAKIMPRVKWK